MLLLKRSNLDLIRLMIGHCKDMLGVGYYELSSALHEADYQARIPTVLFIPIGGGVFEVGMLGKALAVVAPRAGSEAVGELYQVIAAKGESVPLPGSQRAIRSRLIGAADRLARAADSDLLRDYLVDGIHVGNSGAWYDELTKIITG